jgi:hypothetical protein
VGSNVTVTEAIPSNSGDAVSSITVAPTSQLGPAPNPNLAEQTVEVTIGSGVTEVTYTDSTTTGYLEICKQGDVNATGNFTFTVSPGNLAPFSVPLGACSPAIQVTAGPVVITEAPTTPATTIMVACSTIPATGSCLTNPPTNPQTATVTVVPGDVSSETVAVITNGPRH